MGAFRHLYATSLPFNSVRNSERGRSPAKLLPDKIFPLLENFPVTSLFLTPEANTSANPSY